MESWKKNVVQGGTKPIFLLPPLTNIGPNRIVSNKRSSELCIRGNIEPNPNHTQPAHLTNPANHAEFIKKLKRTMARRKYSETYRAKKMNAEKKLEVELMALQKEVAMVNAKLIQMNRQNMRMKAENESVRNKVSAYSKELSAIKAKNKELEKERNWLKQMYYKGSKGGRRRSNKSGSNRD